MAKPAVLPAFLPESDPLSFYAPARRCRLCHEVITGDRGTCFLCHGLRCQCGGCQGGC